METVFQNCTIAHNKTDIFAGGIRADALMTENSTMFDNEAPTDANWQRIVPGTWNNCNMRPLPPSPSDRATGFGQLQASLKQLAR